MSALSLPLIGEDGRLVSELVGTADLLSEHFDINQSRGSVDLPSSCHLSPSPTFAFRSSEVM